MLHTAHMTSPKYVPEFIGISHYGHKDDIYIIQRLCQGRPISYELKNREDLQVIMKKTLLVLRDMHRVGIIHMDIKHDNIIRDHGQFKLVDFGSALFADSTLTTPTRGTPEYMAPEVILNDACCESDVWSAGVMAYQLAYGKFPFRTTKVISTIEEVYDNILEREPDYDGQRLNACQDFLRLCLIKDKADRPTAEELLFHPFLAV